MTKQSETVSVKYKGGGSILSLPPIFSNNLEYVYVCRNNTILSYNVKSGLLALKFKSPEQPIVGFGVGFLDGINIVVSCVKDGTICLWKAENGLKLREFQYQSTCDIVHFQLFQCIDDDGNEYLKALTCCKTNDVYKVDILNISDDKFETFQDKRLMLNVDIEICVDVSENGQYFAIVQGDILFYCAINNKTVRRHRIQNRKFTFVKCHPESNDTLLTGDDTGRVLIWNNLRHRSPSQAVFHWHTLPVKSAAFSNTGTFFYTGGYECVLVKWTLEDNHNKNFIPRLPGFIEHITVSKGNLYVALALSDNSVKIVNPQLQCLTTIQQVVFGNDSSAGLLYDARSRCLLLNGIAGQIQFFSPQDLNVLYSFDVVGQNKYTNERGNTLINTTVTKVSIDKTGLWMATIESRNDPDLFESRLKFWLFDKTQQRFSLNTSIEYPHEGEITEVAFQPSNVENEISCITVGSDRKFKIWQAAKIKTVYREGYMWECTGDVTYRELSPNVLSFSKDGSIVAVGFDSTITIWTLDNCEMKTCLSHPEQRGAIKHLSFGIGPCCHLLFAATSDRVTIWNLLSLSMEQMVRVNVDLVISDEFSAYKAIFSTDRKVYVFELNSGEDRPEVIEIPKAVGEIRAAVFVPKVNPVNDVSVRWHQRSLIYFLTSNFELHAIQSSSEDVARISLFSQIESDRSAFGRMMPQNKVSSLNEQESVVHAYPEDAKKEKTRELLNTPIHVTTPLHLISEDILKVMIMKK